tara:strand:+ start:18193 stop:18888 length:696 start_codon:yes stop_codon:yes gene_type:complete
MTNFKADIVILARGGSKGIPRKNLLPFLGVPLVELSIKQAICAKKVRNIYLSSDSDEILSLASNYEVIQIKRPAVYATDTARSEDAVIDLLKNSLKADLPDVVVMLEPTAPLRREGDIDMALELFFKESADSMFSGAFLEDFLIWKRSSNGQLQSVNYDYKIQGPRQHRKPDIVENGALYLFRPQIMLEESNRFGGKICHFENEFWQSFEIDTIEDWKFVELIYKTYIKNK